MSALPLGIGAIAILKVLYSAVIATIVVTIAFAGAIRAIVRASEMRLLGRRGATLAYSSLAALALAAFAAVVVYGLILMAHKS